MTSQHGQPPPLWQPATVTRRRRTFRARGSAQALRSTTYVAPLDQLSLPSWLARALSSTWSPRAVVGDAQALLRRQGPRLFYSRCTLSRSPGASRPLRAVVPVQPFRTPPKGAHLRLRHAPPNPPADTRARARASAHTHQPPQNLIGVGPLTPASLPHDGLLKICRVRSFRPHIHTRAHPPANRSLAWPPAAVPPLRSRTPIRSAGRCAMSATRS
jgi:hypothetical protein